LFTAGAMGRENNSVKQRALRGGGDTPGGKGGLLQGGDANIHQEGACLPDDLL